MRRPIAGFIAALAVAVPLLTPAEAAPLKVSDITTSTEVLRFISDYRDRPDWKRVPALMRAASEIGTFDDPERCGVYIGFLAGVIGAHPARAEELIARTLPMRAQDRWIVMRAIAYSGLPDWKPLMRRFASRLPRYDALAETYLKGKKATLAQFTVPESPSTLDRLRAHLAIGESAQPVTLEPSPEVLDTLWGYYFGTGSYGPIMHIIAMLPLSRDHNDVERLTIGSMAKYTLARNATRDPKLLAMLKASRKARNQPEATAAVLKEVIEAAETVDTAAIRKEALAAIAELQRKGPAYKRNVSWWGYVGQSAIAGGCLAAAVAGQVALGLPCVVGGAASSAALNFWNNQP